MTENLHENDVDTGLLVIETRLTFLEDLKEGGGGGGGGG